MAIPRSVHPMSGVKGLDVVMANLNREIKNIKGRSLEGLIRSAILIRRDTEKTSPITPVDLGNLRASWFVVSIKGLALDPEGKSGIFKNKPGKKMQFKASQLKADHSALIAESQAVVSVIKDPAVIMGYSANYAMFVHEMIDKHFQRSGAGPKWFETAVKRNKDVIVKTVAKYSTIP